MAISEKYLPITEKERNQLEQALVEALNKDCKPEALEPGFNRYHVTLQDMTYTTELTEEEVEKIAALAVDILEELKTLNNEGFDGAHLKKLAEEEKATEDIFGMIRLWQKLANDRLKKCIVKADEICRVGGAAALFLANPMLINVIYVVYEKIVDHFDDDALYADSSYFLVRAIMKMNSWEG